MADAAAARLKDRIARGRDRQEASKRQAEADRAEVCGSPASAMLFRAWEAEAAGSAAREGQQVYTDVDDTIKSSGGGLAGEDLRYPHKAVYPGVAEFFQAPQPTPYGLN